MDFVVATILFPLLLVVLAIGAGLLVDRAARGVVDGVLIAPIGLAALVVVAELFSWKGATGSLTPYALVVCALAGYALGWSRLRAARPSWWPAAAAVAAFVIACAPVLLAGRVTLTGYLLDTTVGFHLLGSDYLLENGREFGHLPVSTFRLTLEGYFGTQYPSGGHTLLGGAGRVLGIDRIWLYQPFLSVIVGFCAVILYYLARAAAVPRGLAAAVGTFAATPALVYAYVQMGAIKELTALPFVLLLGCVLVALPRLIAAGPRGAAVPAVVAAAGVGAIGLAFLPWLALAGVAALVVLFVGRGEPRPALRPLLFWAGALVLSLIVLALPTFGPLSESLRLAESFSTSNQLAVNDPGNLVRPLRIEQLLGVWITGTHRVDPTNWIQETYLLIGIALVTAVFGLIFLVRNRLWPLAAWVVVSAVVWYALTRRGTTWTDAKVLVLSSPVVMLLVGLGLESLRRSASGLHAGIVGALVAAGILLSNAFAYHDTNLLPTERYKELIEIGERFPSEQPALLPEFDEFALYALQDLPPDGPGFSFKSESALQLREGVGAAYGQSYDLDQFATGAVESYETVVMRRRPDASRPPARFERVFRGRFYDVWRNRGGPDTLAHLPAGAPPQAAGRVDCSELRRAVASAGPGSEIRYVPRPRLSVVDPRKGGRPPSWPEIPQGIGLYAPGRLEAGVNMPASGRYRIWLNGVFGRELRVYVNGRRVGEVSYESGNAGNFASPLQATLSAGRNRLTLERGGGSLKPGDNTPTVLSAILLEPAGAATPVESADPDEWSEVCRQIVDWVEVIRPA